MIKLKSILYRFLHLIGINRHTIVYLACPYSGSSFEKWSRMDKFCMMVAHMQKQGLFVVSPLFMHFVLKYDPSLGNDWNFWKVYSEELLSRVDELHILCLPGWSESKGIQGEIAAAITWGKRIRYIANP